MHVDSGCSASFLHTWKTQQSSTILALCVAARTSDGIWFEHRHFFLEWLVHSLLFMTFCNTLFAVYFCAATYFIDTSLMCVCIYALPPWRVLPSARCLRHTWGVRINDVMLWASFQVLLPSSFISISENVMFHLQRRNPSTPTNWRKTIWYIWLVKRWYTLI